MRNERAGEYSPAFLLPENGEYLWTWFNQINNSVSRLSNGACKLIPPSEFLAWSTLTGNFIHPVEYDILTAMDTEYCRETNLELQAARSKREEEQKRQIEEARTKRRRR